VDHWGDRWGGLKVDHWGDRWEGLKADHWEGPMVNLKSDLEKRVLDLLVLLEELVWSEQFQLALEQILQQVPQQAVKEATVKGG